MNPIPIYYHPLAGTYKSKPSCFDKNKGWLYFGSKEECECYKLLRRTLPEEFCVNTQPQIILLPELESFSEVRHKVDFSISLAGNPSPLVYIEYKGDWVKHQFSAIGYVALKVDLILRQKLPYLLVSKNGDILPDRLKKAELKSCFLSGWVKSRLNTWGEE